jgi:hypothetical protein
MLSAADGTNGTAPVVELLSVEVEVVVVVVVVLSAVGEAEVEVVLSPEDLGLKMLGSQLCRVQVSVTSATRG